MKVLQIVLLFTVGFLTCMVFMLHVFPVKEVTIGTVDTLMVRRIKDYTYMVDSLRRLPVLRIDTFSVRVNERDTTLYMFTIPIMPYHFLDSLPVSVNGVRRFIPFDLHIDGYVTEYSILTHATDLHVEPVRRKINWKAAGIGVGALVLIGAVVLLIAK